MLDTNQQIAERVKGAKRVLLTTRADAEIDSLASCLGLYLTLEKLGIDAEVVVDAPSHVVERCSFLPRIDDAIAKDRPQPHLVIKVDTKNAKLADFRYDVKDEALHIYLTPGKGAFQPSDVKAELGKPAHDLIITCDTPDLNALGSLYDEHAEFFYHTPLINIDHSPANEQYGKINYVDITAVSVTELVFRLLETMGDQHLDEDIATVLLAGMVAETQSFKTPAVTPRSLIVASDLVQRGARREQIIHHLYRQHDLNTLRLWGRVLARLKHDERRDFVWSVVQREDFEKSGANEELLPGIIDELISTTPQAKTVALLYERNDGKIGGWLKTEPHTNALELTKPWHGEGSRVLARFVLPVTSLEDAGGQLGKILPSITPAAAKSNGI